jgi:uncharacterized protein (TIGR03905 family)
MDFSYKTKGVCSRKITFSVENDQVKNVYFDGGCNGNGKGVAALVEGMNVDEAISRMRGIRCGMKETSCPDQLAQALEEAKKSV